VNFHELLLKLSEKHEFPLAGALDLDQVLTPDGAFKDLFKEHLNRYDSWLAEGREGEMTYLRRGRERRADPRLVFPEAQSIFCVAVPYERLARGELDSTKGPRYARYLRGKDYHDVIAERLERLMQEAASEWNTQGNTPLTWKVCVDTSAILERSWAALTGLGWIGKNTTLINPKLGSYLFLGEVLISQKVDQGPNLLPNYCGSCTKCLTSCPTSAFTEPGTLDSRRCISYWTLEKRGELALDEKDRKAIGTWVAGCDICQEVCPFNLKPAREEVAGIDPGLPYIGQSDATTLAQWKELIIESTEAYKKRVEHSALNRVKPQQFSRNLAIALSNALNEFKSEQIAELRPLIGQRVREETDPSAEQEWSRLFQSLLNSFS
jgi:epoxyqueuosine reductase